MNHLEQLVAEWLQYRGYFVRMSVQVGPLPHGGFEGELGVVGFYPKGEHLLHVECSLDAESWAEKDRRFRTKFERGRKFAHKLFPGLSVPKTLDQVAVIQISGTDRREVGGHRLITVRDLVHEIFAGLEGKSPLKGAVPSNLPLLRTLQVAADAVKGTATERRLIPTATIPG